MITEPQPSVAVVTPVALVAVLAGQSRTRFVGAVMFGGVVSRTVIVCTSLALLPQALLAVQVRAMSRVPPQLVVTTSLQVIVTAPQPSCALAEPQALVPVFVQGHSNTTSAGAVMVGLIVSRTVMVWTRLVLLPQSSVAGQVRPITWGPPQLVATTRLQRMAPPPHPSCPVATPVAFVEVLAGHSSTKSAGH